MDKKIKKINLLDGIRQLDKNIDSDDDGLSDCQEMKIYGTDPNNSDTDNDGVSDGLEVAIGKNPAGIGMLKYYFVPYEGNDFKPHILHPHRLAFHALTAVLIKLLVVAWALTFPIEAWLTPLSLGEQAQKIISLTNDLRKRFGLDVLVEDRNLALIANAKAEDMLYQQYFDHVSPTGKKLADWLKSFGYNYSIAGENLAIGYDEPEAVVGAWQKSRTHYANLTDPDFSRIGVGMVAGDYKQSQTVFIAQLFANPPLVVKTASAKTSPESQEDIALASQIATSYSHSATIALNNDQPLDHPALLWPPDKFLTKEKLVKFKIYAPQAETASFFLDGQKIDQQPVVGDIAFFDLAPDEGSHRLMLKSQRGGQSADSIVYSFLVDRTPPVVDVQKTKFEIIAVNSGALEMIKVTAFLSADANKATVLQGNNFLQLHPDDSQPYKWSGQLVIDRNKSKDQTISVMPTLFTEDFAGNSMKTAINWDNIRIFEPSPIVQYFFIKNHQPAVLKSLFDFSSYYYRFILTLAIFSLLLNVFIQIRKQHPRIILSSCGLIVLLAALLLT